MKYKRALQNLLVVSGASFAVLFAISLIDDVFRLEIKKSIAMYFQVVTQEAEPIMYVYNNETGWGLNPNSQYHRGNSGVLNKLANLRNFDVRLRVNADGFIDREHNLTSPHYRIAFVGDSWVEAVQHDFTNRFSQLTENYVFAKSNSTKVVDIMNFGVSNWGMPHYFGATKSKVVKYSPDEIWIFYFSGNDLQDSSEIFNPPPLGPSYIRDHDGHIADVQFGYTHPSAYSNYLREQKFGQSMKKNFRFEVFPYYFSDHRDPDFDSVWFDHAGSFRLLKELVSSLDIHLRLIYIPVIFEVDDVAWSEYVDRVSEYMTNPPVMRRGSGEKKIEKLASDFDIEFVSLSPLIASKGASIMYEDHLSHVGHHWTADFLSDLILESSDLEDLEH